MFEMVGNIGVTRHAYCQGVNPIVKPSHRFPRYRTKDDCMNPLDVVLELTQHEVRPCGIVLLCHGDVFPIDVLPLRRYVYRLSQKMDTL